MSEVVLLAARAAGNRHRGNAGCDRPANESGGHCGKPVIVAIGIAVFDDDTLSFDESPVFSQAFAKRFIRIGPVIPPNAAEISDHWHCLLRASNERPRQKGPGRKRPRQRRRCRRTRKPRNEVAPPHAAPRPPAYHTHLIGAAKRRRTGQSGFPWFKARRIALAASTAGAAEHQVRTSQGGVMLMGWFRLNIVAALALAIASTASLAQQWPTHPVRFVLPFGPGSGADIAARLITDTLQQKWGQPVIIDGKPGGDGLLSLQTVVSAKDDHTFFFGPSSIFVVQRYMHEDISFDPETDLSPIAGVAKVQIAIAVPTKVSQYLYARRPRQWRWRGAKPSETSYAVAPGSLPNSSSTASSKKNGLAVAQGAARRRSPSRRSILGENRIQLSMQSYAAMRDLCADREDQVHRHQRSRAIAHRAGHSVRGRVPGSRPCSPVPFWACSASATCRSNCGAGSRRTCSARSTTRRSAKDWRSRGSRPCPWTLTHTPPPSRSSMRKSPISRRCWVSRGSNHGPRRDHPRPPLARIVSLDHDCSRIFRQAFNAAAMLSRTLLKVDRSYSPI